MAQFFFPLNYTHPLRVASLFAGGFICYFILAGFCYCYFWRGGAATEARKLATHPPYPGQIRKEIACSLLTLFLYGLAAAVIYCAREHNLNLIYDKISKHGWPYAIFSFFALLFLHETYFYWTHRALHAPRWWKFHRTHHLSKMASPWAAFAFHPVEASLEVLFFLLVVEILPLHRFTLLSFFPVMTFFAVEAHLSYEFHRAGFSTHPLFRWVTNPTHHFLHHKLAHGNYGGFYFTFWDKVMRTECPQYLPLFSKVSKAPNALRLTALGSMP